MNTIAMWEGGDLYFSQARFFLSFFISKLLLLQQQPRQKQMSGTPRGQSIIGNTAGEGFLETLKTTSYTGENCGDEVTGINGEAPAGTDAPAATAGRHRRAGPARAVPTQIQAEAPRSANCNGSASGPGILESPAVGSRTSARGEQRRAVAGGADDQRSRPLHRRPPRSPQHTGSRSAELGKGAADARAADARESSVFC